MHHRIALAAMALVLACCLPALAGEMVTLAGCRDGCPPGDNKCYRYCEKLFQPCFDDCAEMARTFVPECAAGDRQFPNNSTREAHCTDLLFIVNAQCNNSCRSIKKEVDYPNWMGEQPCEYDCQRWNPASRTCVGAKMNGCGGW